MGDVYYIDEEPWSRDFKVASATGLHCQKCGVEGKRTASFLTCATSAYDHLCYDCVELLCKALLELTDRY